MGSAQGPVTSELEQARTPPEFGAHTPLPEKLLAVAIRAQNFTGSSGVAIALTEGEQMICRASWGTSAPDVGARLSIEHSFTGLCVRTGEPQRCDDAQDDPRVDPEACRSLGISAIAAAPVRRGLKVVGVIAAFSDTPHAFTDKHLLILTTLSEVIVELLDESAPGSSSAARPARKPAVIPAEPEPLAALEQAAPQPGSTSAAVFESAPAVAASGAPAAPAVPATSRAVSSPPKKPVVPASKESAPHVDEVLPQKKDEPLPVPVGRHSTTEPAKAESSGSSSVRLVPLTQPAPAPEFAPELTFSSYQEPASPQRRWLVIAAALVIVLMVVAAWRWYAAKIAHVASPVSAASVQPAAAAPQTPPAQETTPARPPVAETKHSPFNPAPATSSPAKAAPVEMPDDVTIRNVPQPVIATAGPLRRPSAGGASGASQVPEPQAPQLALASPELPALVGKPSSTVIAAPVARAASRVVPAHLISRVSPVYPEAARRIQLTGKVVLKTTITKNGTVGNIQWVSGSELFRASAAAAVKQWRYRPAMLNGQPVESDLQVVLEFNRPGSQ